MKTDRASYRNLIDRLEKDIHRQPQLYYLRVLLLIIAGYGYIALVTFLLLILAAFFTVMLIKFPFFAVKCALPLFLVFYFIARCFWVKFAPVQGVQLDKAGLPVLFQTIEEIRANVGGPPLHHVLLVPDFNAGVVQRPRLGFFGWHENSLVLGMELMNSLSYKEFRAVLAHEMGHLSGNHGKLSSFVYGARTTWAQLLVLLRSDPSIANVLFKAFFLRFVPYFDAYTFVLTRKHEYDADQLASQCEGPDIAAQALIKTRIRSAFIQQRYWPSLINQANLRPAPPETAYSSMAGALAHISAADAEEWLNAALLEKSNLLEVHPCLMDRLSSILRRSTEDCKSYAHSVLKTLSRPEQTAAKVLFEDKLAGYLQSLDRRWIIDIAGVWAERHTKYVQASSNLAILKERQANGGLRSEELGALALCTAQVNGLEEARPLFLQALAQKPDSVELNFIFGDYLREAGSEECVPYLERVIELEPLRTVDCCRVLHSFFLSKGKDETAEKYKHMLEDASAIILKAKAERSKILPNDSFMEHGLSPEQIRFYENELSQIPYLKSAFMLRKCISHFPHHPLLVILIEPKWHPVDHNIGTVVANTVRKKVGMLRDTLVVQKSTAPACIKKAVKRFQSAKLDLNSSRVSTSC